MINLDLESISILLNHLGNPQDSIPKIIHIAGTNGKGSTSAIVSYVLTSHSLKVGRFNSPFLIEPCDAISINNIPLRSVDYFEMKSQISYLISKFQLSPSPFEITTAIALACFAREKVDIAVVEVGMGGRLDATNVFKNPTVCAFTAIGLDHVEFLGDSVELIAMEKSGIIKHGCIVVIGPQTYPEATRVLESRAKEKACSIVFAQAAQRKGNDEATVKIDGEEVVLPFPLAGDFQLENLGTAMAICQQVSSMPLECYMKGLSSVRWRGRLELVESRYGSILVDGAHNIDGARQLAQYVNAYVRSPGNKPIYWIYASSAGKDVKAILSTLVREGDQVMLVGFGPVEEMPWVKPFTEWDVEMFPNMSITTLEDALIKRQMFKGSAVLCGSLYLIAEFYRYV